MNVVVSISCITYNHAPYIRECLDGFLMQQCDFDFEILIHDDASTDGTQEIIKKYQLKYPEIIKPIFQTENQWSKGVRGINFRFNFPRAKGKYIALCEGDDYWTDPQKLQKQVDFLEKNEDFSFCFHRTSVLYKDKLVSSAPFNWRTVFTIEDLIINLPIPKRALSMMFRKKAIPDPFPFSWMRPGQINLDFTLQILAARNGKIKYLKKDMGVYRVHSGGVWSSEDAIKKIDSSIENLYFLEGRFENQQKWKSCFNKGVQRLMFQKVEEYIKLGDIRLAKQVFKKIDIRVVKYLAPHGLYRFFKVVLRLKL